MALSEDSKNPSSSDNEGSGSDGDVPLVMVDGDGVVVDVLEPLDDDGVDALESLYMMMVLKRCWACSKEPRHGRCPRRSVCPRRSAICLLLVAWCPRRSVHGELQSAFSWWHGVH